MSRSFLHMDNHEVAAALRVLSARGEVELLGEGLVPEADFFLCRWRGKRVNAKFDLAYGPDLHFIERCTAQEQAELEALIAAVEPRTG